jgi:glycosyltransferase involved in cell wall biosynthesis
MLYSTEKNITIDKPILNFVSEDKFKSKLFLKNGQTHNSGGLRSKGKFKKSLQDKPLITIITITLNSEKYLEQTILSVLNQPYENVEYIVIDGGSTDGTVEIIKKYDNFIDYWISEKDKGVSNAFNKGIVFATGDIIGLINSDDWYEPETFNKVTEVFENDKSIGLIHGDLSFWKDARFLFTLFPHENPERLWKEMIYNHPTCFVSLETYKKHGFFDETLKLAMDYDLILRFYVKGVKFKYVNDVLANLRLEGLSDKQAIQSFREVLASSIHYGYSSLNAHLWYFYKVLKEKLKKVFGNASPVLRFYRSFSSRKECEK